jgi:hypothetical protein
MSSNEIQVTSASIEPAPERPSKRGPRLSLAVALVAVAGVVVAAGLGPLRRARDHARFERAAAAVQAEPVQVAAPVASASTPPPPVATASITLSASAAPPASVVKPKPAMAKKKH